MNQNQVRIISILTLAFFSNKKKFNHHREKQQALFSVYVCLSVCLSLHCVHCRNKIKMRVSSQCERERYERHPLSWHLSFAILTNKSCFFFLLLQIICSCLCKTGAVFFSLPLSAWDDNIFLYGICHLFDKQMSAIKTKLFSFFFN